MTHRFLLVRDAFRFPSQTFHFTSLFFVPHPNHRSAIRCVLSLHSRGIFISMFSLLVHARDRSHLNTFLLVFRSLVKLRLTFDSSAFRSPKLARLPFPVCSLPLKSMSPSIFKDFPKQFQYSLTKPTTSLRLLQCVFGRVSLD